jgi:hypothetical protein
MGVNPLISVGAPIAGNLVSALVSNQARRRAQERLNSLQTPQLPAFRRNPLLGQRIAQQQQLADQPMMGYQRAADEQAGRQFERGRQIAANLGGGAGLAYMQGVSSSIADQQRRGLLNDMATQQRNRAGLDQLINIQNQEMAQERAQEQLGYQMAMQDFMDQRSGLQSDINQQRSNIGASLGAILGDIPNYMTSINNYKSWKKMSEKEKSDAVAMDEEAQAARESALNLDYKYTPSSINSLMSKYRRSQRPGVSGIPIDLQKVIDESLRENLFPDYRYRGAKVSGGLGFSIPEFRMSQGVTYDR